MTSLHPTTTLVPAQSISLESLFRRDRIVILAGLAFTTALAWIYMVYESRAMLRTGVCECMGLAMAGPDTRAWSAPW